MAKINCKEYRCKHYYCDTCMQGGIEVNNGAVCENFSTKNDQIIDAEFGLEENFLANHFDKEVLCHCHSCASYRQGQCEKSKIDITSVDNLARCISYEKK